MCFFFFPLTFFSLTHLLINKLINYFCFMKDACHQETFFCFEVAHTCEFTEYNV